MTIPITGLRSVEEADDGPLVFDVERPIGPQDLAARDASGPVGSSPSPLKRIAARHHSMAKMLAEGARPSLVASVYGFSVSRISILQRDPAFAELIAHYRREADFDSRRVQERLADMSVEAIDALNERLEREPEKITNAQLMRLIEITADRTGHGPKASQDVNVNIGFAEKLREARKRVAEATDGRVIEGKALPSAVE